MAKSKDGKAKRKTASTDGRRKETKEERAARLKSQAEAREKCFQALPYVGGAIVAFLLLFALYVRSVPKRLITTIPANSTLSPDVIDRLGPDNLEHLTKSGLISKDGEVNVNTGTVKPNIEKPSKAGIISGSHIGDTIPKYSTKDEDVEVDLGEEVIIDEIPIRVQSSEDIDEL